MINVLDEYRTVNIFFDYRPSTLSEAQASRVAHMFKQAVSSILSASDDQAIANTDILSSDEEQQILQWNSTPLKIVERCAHDRFGEQVLARPEALAICAWDGELRYEELDQLSTKIAHYLVALGVKPNQFVPFCMEKSKWAVVAILSILKAGGAFVPMDPVDSAHRKRIILADLNAQIVLTSNQHWHDFENLKIAGHVVAVDAVPLDSLCFSDLPLTGTLPSDIAYAIFTSGSTGKPKAVVMNHSAYSSAMQAHGSALNFARSSRVFQFSAYIWDVGLAEMMTTLSTGGCICIPSDDDRINRMASVMEDMKVNFASLTPSVVRSIKPQQVPSLEVLILTGEAVSKTDLAVWAHHVQLINAYGPAEACIYTTSTPPLSRMMLHDNVGTGLGLRCWITDRKNPHRLMPIGTVGEILIEGPSLAKGYLNDTVKTHAAFVSELEWAKCRMSIDSNARRFYRSGDLGRLNGDGTISLVGRADGQVKIRGQRLELGEVETHLLSNEKIRHSVVLFPKSGPYQRQLVGIVVLEEVSHEIEKERRSISLKVCNETEQHFLAAQILAIAESLKEQLQVHSIPHEWIVVEDLPRSAAGKLDRVSIHRWLVTLEQKVVESSSTAASQNIEPPITPMEQRLQSEWAEVLGIAPLRIGRGSSFFRLGGDSIRAMILVAALRSEGIVLSVADIFKYPKLERLSARASHAAGKPGRDVEIPLFSMIPQLDSPEKLKIEVGRACNITTDDVEDVYPATPLQEGLLTLTTKQSGAYIARYTAAIPPTVEVDQLQAAWRTVVRAHAILRTRILATKEHGIVQVVNRFIDPWIENDQLNQMMRNENCFMAFGDPLFYVGVDAKRRLVVIMHHVLFDAWSLPLLLHDLVGAYQSGATPINRPPFRYFVRHLQMTNTVQSQEFWSNYLTGAEKSSFPPNSARKRGPRSVKSVSHTITMKESPEKSDITTATRIQLAWGLVICRYLDLYDVTFGINVSGRDTSLDGITTIIGPTIATVPLRLRINPEMDIATMLREIQEHTGAMIRHQHFGLHSISRIDEHTRLACDFKNLLIIYPPASGDLKPLGLNFKFQENEDFQTQPLTILCREQNDCIEVTARYKSDEIAGDQVSRILGQMNQTYNALVARESSSLKEAMGVSDADVGQIIQWNSITHDAREENLVEIFQRQAAVTGDALAVDACDGRLSYGELDTFSTRLSRHLIDIGVKAEVFVPFCFEKTRWAIVTILGILKAGGACVPMGPGHPDSRKQRVLADVGARFVLASRACTESMKTLIGRVVTIDATFFDQVVLQEDPAVTPRIKPDQAAYVIFTSGSTGVPKGVVWEHKMLSTTVMQRGLAFGLKPGSRVLQFAAYSFDVSVADILGTLTHSASLCIPSEEDRMNNLSGFISRFNVDWALLTPTTARLLEPQAVPSLKTLVVGGEALGDDIVQTWKPYVRLLQAYGTAECGIDCCAKEIVDEGGDNIGRGCGATIWITDAHDPNYLVPIGAVGEILVEGPNLARGYLNDDAKTRASFVQDLKWVESATSPRRFYRTGDLGKYELDGTISFVGRRDNQIKLHGQRLELNEVEHHLSQHPAVKHAAVLFPGEGFYKQKLVAVFTLESFAQEFTQPEMFKLCIDSQADAVRPKLAAIEEDLERRLPRFAVPSAFIAVETLPHTMSRKLDRVQIMQWLLRMTPESVETGPNGKVIEYPETEMECRLQLAWAQILDIPTNQVGRKSSFFSLGGDSVHAMSLVAALRVAGIELSVMNIFKQPRLIDVAKAASFIDGEDEESTRGPFSLLPPSADVEAIVRETSSQCKVGRHVVKDVYPATPLQEGLISLTAKHPKAYVAVYTFLLPPDINTTRLRQAWRKVVESHSILRSRLISSLECGTLQVVLDTDSSIYDQTNEMTFGGPLSSLAVNDRQVTMAIHHALFDGWSLSLLISDVNRAYHTGQVVERPPYRHFIEYLQQTNLKQSRDFWTNYLADVPDSTFPRLRSSTYTPDHFETAHHTVNFTRKPGSDITSATVLQVAWGLVIARHLDVEDVTYGLSVLGRDAPVKNITAMLGPTIATVPLRIRIKADMHIGTLLHTVQQDVASMIPHEHVGLQTISRISQEARTACDFQNLLLINNTEMELVEVKGGPLGAAFDAGDLDQFQTFALTMACRVGRDRLGVTAKFDPRVVEYGLVLKFLDQFGEFCGAVVKEEEAFASWASGDTVA